MMEQTRRCLAAEFKQKSRWSSVWPNMRYGAMYLNYSVGRQLPMRGVNWVTRESNRLTNFSHRYRSVIADIDVRRTEEELNIPLSDIRWNDHRRIYWKCAFCASPYRKGVSMRTKFHAGCPHCKKRFPSEVFGAQKVSASLADAAPELLAQLADAEARPNVGSLSHTSKFNALWTCRGCGQSYRATIRSRCGRVESGQCALHPKVAEWTAYCPSCAWRPNMERIAAEVKRSGQYLGFDTQQGKETQTQHIPRRKRLVL